MTDKELVAEATRVYREQSQENDRVEDWLEGLTGRLTDRQWPLLAQTLGRLAEERG